MRSDETIVSCPATMQPTAPKLVSTWCQSAPIVPVLPVPPTSNQLAVNKLTFLHFHGMEEVIGSIPIRSTKYIRPESAT